MYGTAAIRSILAELRQAITKEERAYKTIGGHKKTWGGIKVKNEGRQDEITETKEEGIEMYNWDEHREIERLHLFRKQCRYNLVRLDLFLWGGGGGRTAGFLSHHQLHF